MNLIIVPLFDEILDERTEFLMLRIKNLNLSSITLVKLLVGQLNNILLVNIDGLFLVLVVYSNCFNRLSRLSPLGKSISD